MNETKEIRVFLACNLTGMHPSYVERIDDFKVRLEWLKQIKDVFLFTNLFADKNHYRKNILNGIYNSDLLIVIADNLSLNLGYLIAQAEKVEMPILVFSHLSVPKIMSDYPYLHCLAYDDQFYGFRGVIKRVEELITNNNFWPIRANFSAY